MQLRAAGKELTRFLMRVLTPKSAHQSYVATRQQHFIPCYLLY